jgi:hypothetical protein
MLGCLPVTTKRRLRSTFTEDGTAKDAEWKFRCRCHMVGMHDVQTTQAVGYNLVSQHEVIAGILRKQPALYTVIGGKVQHRMYPKR